MSAVKTSVNPDSSSVSAVNVDSTLSSATTVQFPIVDNEYGEKLATIDQLPRGTALHAARTPRSKESAQFPKQQTGTGAAVLATSTSTAAKLMHSNSSLNYTNEHVDATSTSEPEAPTNNEPPRKTSIGPDLARRAARRVNVWKQSEQDRRGEEERARQVKLEQEKRRQNHAAHAKQRRRAEIYALNALLRQLQQEKVARYIAAQKQIQETACQQEANLSDTTAALAQVRAVGV